MVIREKQEPSSLPLHRPVKHSLSLAIAFIFRNTPRPVHKWRRLVAHAALSSKIRFPLDASTVVLGQAILSGTGNIRIGRNVLLYPRLHLETQQAGFIDIGDNVVISSGVHIVSMARVTIGEGSMIGEYAGIRDANHARAASISLRDAGYSADPIVIGREVWIGRGVSILRGVTIGDGATVGANAVVTSDVQAGAVVAGAPARAIRTDKLPLSDCDSARS